MNHRIDGSRFFPCTPVDRGHLVRNGQRFLKKGQKTRIAQIQGKGRKFDGCFVKFVQNFFFDFFYYDASKTSCHLNILAWALKTVLFIATAHRIGDVLQPTLIVPRFPP